MLCDRSYWTIPCAVWFLVSRMMYSDCHGQNVWAVCVVIVVCLGCHKCIGWLCLWSIRWKYLQCFKFCDFLFTILGDTWRSSFIPWTHFTQMRPQLPWISDVLFDDTLIEWRFSDWIIAVTLFRYKVPKRMKHWFIHVHVATICILYVLWSVEVGDAQIVVSYERI